LIGDIDDMIYLLNNSVIIERDAAGVLSGTLVYGTDYTRDTADDVITHFTDANISVDRLYVGVDQINTSATLGLIQKSGIVFDASHAEPEIWFTGTVPFISSKDLTSVLDTHPLIVTLGCHGALFLSSMNPADSLALSFIKAGASGYIGNTGFGIVCNYAVKHSEEFYVNLMQNLLKKDVTIGGALLETKRAWSWGGGIDKKVALEVVLYGNPKNKVFAEINVSKPETVYVAKTPFYRLLREVGARELFTTHREKLRATIEIDPAFIANETERVDGYDKVQIPGERTAIVSGVVVPSIGIEPLKLPPDVNIEEVVIQEENSKSELISEPLTLPRENLSIAGVAGNADIELGDREWTQVIWHEINLPDGSKRLEVEVIPLKPYNETHYEVYTNIWVEVEYVKSLARIIRINATDTGAHVTIRNNDAREPMDFYVSFLLKKTSGEVIDVKINQMTVDENTTNTSSFTWDSLDEGSYVIHVRLVDNQGRVVDSKQETFEVRDGMWKALREISSYYKGESSYDDVINMLREYYGLLT